MQKTTRLSVLRLTIAALAVATASVLGGEMKPYKGWTMFPPTTGPDGASYNVRCDNVGGMGVRRAVRVGALPPVVDPANKTVTLTAFEEGVLTYPNGDTLTDSLTVVLVVGFDGLVRGGTVDGVITGGTGRLEGAYGWARVEATFNPPLDLATVEPFRLPFEGMISTVGSLQRTNPERPQVD